MESNYSRGRFQFALQSDGALSLYTKFPLDTPNYVYWSTLRVVVFRSSSTSLAVFTIQPQTEAYFIFMWYIVFCSKNRPRRGLGRSGQVWAPGRILHLREL
ncbi:unnamed protein product [Prunus brigantina]